MVADIAIENTVYRIGGLSVDREIVRYIQEASEVSGVNFDYMMAKAGHESLFKVNAMAKHSSAEGLFQFTMDTWLQQLKLHGAKYGYAKSASKIYRDGRGRYRVKSKADRDEILSLRRSPRISALMAAEFAKTNKKILENQVGGNISSMDLYLAHFMGPTGAVMLMRADKFTPYKYAADLFPEAALANRPIFYTKNHKMRTVRQVRQYIEDMFEDKIRRYTVLPHSLKVWLDKQSKGRRLDKQPSVVVNAPILKIETKLTAEKAGKTPPAPMPKVVESLKLAKILPGEGVNLDDEEVLADFASSNVKIKIKTQEEEVTADFIPLVYGSYQVAGVTEMESEAFLEKKVRYTPEKITFFETDEYVIQTPLPSLMTAELSLK